MGKIVAIDYGKKRTGIAVTDDLQIIASGLTTVDTSNLNDFIKTYLATEQVEALVIGLPKKLDNSIFEIEIEIQKFIAFLKENFPSLSIERIDERFTSKMAFQSMLEGGMKKKQRQNKALIDEISATLILQSYLNSK
jgi:putative Holliday junction resolvase